MERSKLRYLQELVAMEVKVARERYAKVKSSADEIAYTSANSPSQSGDRFHSQGQVEIVKATLIRLEHVFTQLKTDIKSTIPDSIQSACYVQLVYKEGFKDDFYFLSEPLALSGVKIVSSNSPFGRELISKKVGAEFAFDLNGNKKVGKIVAIE